MARFRINFVSDSVKDAMDVYVIIPQKKQVRTDREPDIVLGSFSSAYPLLMLLHDEASSPEELLNMSRAERYANEHQVMLVVPAGLLSFYTDYAERDAASNTANAVSGNAGIENNFTEMCYETYIMDVLEYVRRIFPVASRSRETTWIGGIGMGGFGAVKLGMKYPDCFSRVFSISGDVDLQWKMDNEPWRREQFMSIFGALTASGDNDLPGACLKAAAAGNVAASEAPERPDGEAAPEAVMQTEAAAAQAETAAGPDTQPPRLMLLWQENDGKALMNERLRDAIYGRYPGLVTKVLAASCGWDHVDEGLLLAFDWAALEKV